MNIRLMKQLDASFGRLLSLLLPAASQFNQSVSFANTLFIRPGGIGDAVLLAPVLRTFKKKFPDAKLTVLAERRNAGIFALIPEVDQVLRYDLPRELLAVFRLHPELVIDTEQYHCLSTVLASLLGRATRIGFATNGRARLFHRAIPYSHDDYEVDSFFHLVAPLEVMPPLSFDIPFLTVPEESRTIARQLLAPLADDSFVVLFPGASIPERRWNAERLRQVAAGLNKIGYKVVLVGGTEDVEVCEAIMQSFATASLNLAGKTSLAGTAAILQRASLLISGDSSVLHLGVGLGVPTVSLFGPGRAKKWAPKGKQHIVLNKNFPCSPCTTFGYTDPCPCNAACLQQIPPEWVVDSAVLLLPKNAK
ncbi:MAG: glycosyltransferase family 9 protein [Desulfobulbus sp.]|jgi:lipopolysaccharide heptosyltransferase II|uniref:glycosyltransferase family 9 protein n=1 Tax=Desulfobulbus sp. TaxID=895 RepID=UPI00283C6386|nr:glycosyltransferase family 9 protein [Desulfobulbus sp.]MDR2550391.1 glycosyltransferase family 9 protein [Desulfobulbus sp.]